MLETSSRPFENNGISFCTCTVKSKRTLIFCVHQVQPVTYALSESQMKLDTCLSFPLSQDTFLLVILCFSSIIFFEAWSRWCRAKTDKHEKGCALVLVMSQSLGTTPL